MQIKFKCQFNFLIIKNLKGYLKLELVTYNNAHEKKITVFSRTVAPGNYVKKRGKTRLNTL